MKLKIGMIFYCETHLWYVTNVSNETISFICFFDISKDNPQMIKKNKVPKRNFENIFNRNFTIQFA